MGHTTCFGRTGKDGSIGVLVGESNVGCSLPYFVCSEELMVVSLNITLYGTVSALDAISTGIGQQVS